MLCFIFVLILNISLPKFIQKQIELTRLSLCFIRGVYLLIILRVLEEIEKLKEKVEVITDNVDYIRGDVADIKEAVKDTKIVKKDVEEIKILTETISKTNGEFYLIAFCFVLNVLMNSDSLNKSDDA